MYRLKVLVLLSLAISIFGCSHPLEVKNIDDYQSSSFSTLSRDLSIGIITANNNSNGRILVSGAVRALSNYVGNIVYPYSLNDSRQVDIISKITVRSNHKGSGANFFINFPGFLIWAPAWNGYVYKPSYDIDVEMLNASDRTIIDSFSIPIRLNVRHASMNRTWTEVAWLEFGSIALVSGFIFIQYDETITPLIEKSVKYTIGDYLAQEISKRLGNTTGYKNILLNKKQKNLSPAKVPMP